MKHAYLLVLLAACATQPEMAWYKAGSTEADFRADAGYCRAQAFSVASGNLYQIAIVQDGCMEAKGWVLMPRR
jgi:hypothetical protein